MPHVGLRAISLLLPRVFEIRSNVSILLGGSQRASTALEVSSGFPKQNQVPLHAMLANHIRNGRMDDAKELFVKVPSPSVYMSTIMITGYSKFGRIGEALQTFYDMPFRDIASWNAMISSCLKCCDDLRLAFHLFNEMPERDVVSWTTMITGFAQHGQIESARELFINMPWKDSATYNAMISGYCRNRMFPDALVLFREMPEPNVITWTSLISGGIQTGEYDTALSFFLEMKVAGVHPSSSTLVCVLSACSGLRVLTAGVQIHGHVIKNGNIKDDFIVGALITLYAAGKDMIDCKKVFDEVEMKNVVLWTALLTGYGNNDQHQDAIDVFCSMLLSGMKPNQLTYTSVLNSCCKLELLDRAKCIHSRTVKAGYCQDAFVGSSLVAVYSACNELDDAIMAFKCIKEKTVVSWNSVIGGCAKHGRGHLAIELFHQMDMAGEVPDEITYVCLLTACSHAGLIDEGKYFFEQFKRNKMVNTNLEHYTCMVDLLGRSGELDEAEKLILKMPVRQNVGIWLALLSACRVHSNLEIAERTAHLIFDLDPLNTAAYVLLSNIYAHQGRWSQVWQLRMMMKERSLIKVPGCSWEVVENERVYSENSDM